MMKKVRNLFLGLVASGLMLMPTATFATNDWTNSQSLGMQGGYIPIAGAYANIFTPGYTYTANGYRDDVSVTIQDPNVVGYTGWEGSIGYTFANGVTNPRYSFNYYNTNTMSSPYEVFSSVGPAMNSAHDYQVAYEPSNNGYVGRAGGVEIGSSPYTANISVYEFTDVLSDPNYSRHDGSVSAAVKWSNPEYLTNDLSQWIPTGTNANWIVGGYGGLNTNYYSGNHFFYTWDTRN